MADRILLLTVLQLVWLQAFSQNTQDAVRNADRFYSGTAKFNSLGGAMGAIGADASLANTNPAGFGLYRKSEFNVSPSVNWRNTTTCYNGTDATDSKSRIELNNLAFAFHKNTDKRTGLTEFTWGLGFIRTASYHEDYIVAGKNPGSSVLDEHTFDLNNPSPIDTSEIRLEPSIAYGAALSWNTFLTDYDPDRNEYFHANSFYEGSQKQKVEQRGATNQYQLSIGGNFNDLVFLGASLEISDFKYINESIYIEEIKNGEYTSLQDFSFEERLRIDGIATRLRVGSIIQATQFMRIGLAYHFAYTTRMNDEFNNIMNSDFGNGQWHQSASPKGSFSYRVRSPGRMIVSTALQVKKRAMFGLEYELVNMSKAEFSGAENGYDYEFENSQINKELGYQHYIRFGGEYRKGTLALRGGYRFASSPYKNEDVQSNRSTFSTGIGFRDSNAYADITYLYNIQQEQVYMFDPAFADAADKKLQWHSIMLTLGLRWN